MTISNATLHVKIYCASCEIQFDQDVSNTFFFLVSGWFVQYILCSHILLTCLILCLPMLYTINYIAVWCILFIIIIMCANQLTAVWTGAAIMYNFTSVPTMTGAQVSNWLIPTLIPMRPVQKAGAILIAISTTCMKNLMAPVAYMTVSCQLQLIFSFMLALVVW